MKKKVAIITGGNVAEREVSLKSAATIHKHLNKDRYETYVIELEGTDFLEQSNRTVIDKNDFSLPVPDGKNIYFDFVFLMLHGHPAEDGCLQGYFEVLNIPYSGCDHFVSALTFNKQVCKDYLRPFQIPMAKSELIYKSKAIDEPALKALGLPLFVKPNKNGSSYGITKVNNFDEIKGATEKAFQFDEEVIVEQFLEGREFSNGVVRKGDELVVFPVTEIITKNDFFDFKAKYENESEEVTPANLTPVLQKQVQELSLKLYEDLNCKGLVRFDTILVGDTFHFLEANTIPGFSEQSLFPQQARAHGWTIEELLDCVVEESLKDA
ncbi:MAG: D-alanine-D-alanine ligase [Polaribacter sp.]|jgi:D-alanine-D-alanine ligase